MKQTEALGPSVVMRIKKLKCFTLNILPHTEVSLLDAISSHYNTLLVGRLWAGLCGVRGHVIRAVLLGKSGNKADGLWSAEPGCGPETLKQRRGGQLVWSGSAWWSGRLLRKSGELRSVMWLPGQKTMLISGLSAWLLVGAESVERAAWRGSTEVEG